MITQRIQFQKNKALNKAFNKLNRKNYFQSLFKPPVAVQTYSFYPLITDLPFHQKWTEQSK